MSLKIFLLLLCTMCANILISATESKNVGTSTMYVFAYSWQPEFCYGETTAYPGCAAPQTFWKTHFTIHGLWPQYTTSGYPSTCTTEAFNSTLVEQAIGMPTLTNYWPNVQYSETSSQYPSFWEHEWSKHGTCSGLSQTGYFQAAINLIQKYGTPAGLSAAVGSTMSAATLRSNMGGASYVSLQCTSGKYLNGAYSCWSQASGLPVALSACPSDVIAEDTCTATTLTIQAF